MGAREEVTMGLPLVLTCPGGHTYPATSFKSEVVRLSRGLPNEDLVFLTCPAGHTFTLREATQAGMFDTDQMERILVEAARLVSVSRKRKRR